MTDISNAKLHSRLRLPGAIETYAPSPLLTGLVGYWKLDEASGNRLDSLALNNMVPSGTVAQAAGKVGSAVSVATGGNFLAAGGSLTPAGASRSVSAWVYPTDVSAQRTPISAASTSASGTPLYMIVLRQGGGSGAVAVYHGGAYRVGTTVVAASTWYHVVYTYNFSGTDVGLWINGTREVTVTAGDTNSMTNIYLGQGFSDFAGRIDEVGVWNRALSSSEIASLYNGGNGDTYPNFA